MKRSVAFCLSVVLLIGIVLFSGANPFGVQMTASAETQRDPIVLVTGFAASPLCKDGERVMPASGSAIAKTIAALTPAYSAYRLTGNEKAFASKIVSEVSELFAPLKCDDYGVPVDKTITLERENIVTADQPYGKRNYFYYDFRQDVTQTAADLNDYINAILAATGKKTVALICSSMGTCVGAAYLERFGSAKLSSLTFSSAAALGLPLVSMLLSGTLPMTESVLYDYLQSLNLLEKANLSDAVKRTIDTFGGFDAILRDLAHVASKEKATLFQGLVIPFTSKMPGLWSLVESDALDACKAATGVRPGSTLERKIDNYQKFGRKHVIENLRRVRDRGVKFAVLSNYTDTTTLPEDGLLSDGLIPAALTSLGATCAPFGERLPFRFDTESEALDFHAPDGTIDASSCAFPENTWFVRGAAHTVTDAKFFQWIAYTGDVNIDSNDAYPQFMEMTENGVYVPQMIDPALLPPEVLRSIPVILARIKELLRHLGMLREGRAA